MIPAGTGTSVERRLCWARRQATFTGSAPVGRFGDINIPKDNVGHNSSTCLPEKPAPDTGLQQAAAGTVFAHSDVFHTQTAPPAARSVFRAAMCPRPARKDHNRQDATHLQKAALHNCRESLGPPFIFHLMKTHLQAPDQQAAIVGKRVPGDVHCQPDRENESAPEHDHDARRQKPVQCASQKTALFGGIRAIDFGAPTTGSVSLQERKQTSVCSKLTFQRVPRNST